MVLPYVNMTIKGALWWQGENNAFQCHNAGSKFQSAHDKNGKGLGGTYLLAAAVNSFGHPCCSSFSEQADRTRAVLRPRALATPAR